MFRSSPGIAFIFALVGAMLAVSAQAAPQYCSDKTGGVIFVPTAGSTAGLTCPAVPAAATAGGGGGGSVAIGLDAGGCNPDTLALPSGNLTLVITNSAGTGEFEILQGDQTVAKLDKIDPGQTENLNVDLDTGYYTVECRTDDAITTLTVGVPDGPAPNLGAGPLPTLSAPPGFAPSDGNNYAVTNLVANSPSYNPQIVDPSLVDAWGLANRPAGAGGHIWVASNISGTSLEYIGDVGGVPLYQGDLRLVSVPGAPDADNGAPAGTTQLGEPTGVVFNPNSAEFVITQGDLHTGAKFLFAGKDGVISAWTERDPSAGPTEEPPWATVVADRSAQGSQFFGLAIAPDGAHLLVADFGQDPAVRVYNDSFQEQTNAGFANPFVQGAVKPGDFLPWNVTTIGQRVFVSYAAVGADESNANSPSIGEENHDAGLGKIVEYDAQGNLVKIWDDGKALDSPWGVTVAPAGFGKLTGDFLVANFGDGTIAAFTPDGKFADYVRGADGKPVVVDGIWALLPGNGTSLGAANSVYFTAGPRNEQDGVFGRLDAAAKR